MKPLGWRWLRSDSGPASARWKPAPATGLRAGGSAAWRSRSSLPAGMRMAGGNPLSRHPRRASRPAAAGTLEHVALDPRAGPLDAAACRRVRCGLRLGPDARGPGRDAGRGTAASGGARAGADRLAWRLFPPGPHCPAAAASSVHACVRGLGGRAVRPRGGSWKPPAIRGSESSTFPGSAARRRARSETQAEARPCWPSRAPRCNWRRTRRWWFRRAGWQRAAAGSNSWRPGRSWPGRRSPPACGWPAKARGGGRCAADRGPGFNRAHQPDRHVRRRRGPAWPPPTYTLPRRPTVPRRPSVEAMAAGVPSVAIDVPLNRWLLGDDAAGLLVPPENAAALAAAIVRLLDDPAWPRGLGRRLAAGGSGVRPGEDGRGV